MKTSYKYSIEQHPSGFFVKSVFSYRELALLALVIWKYKVFTNDNSNMLLLVEKHLNDLLDQIDKDKLI